MTVKVTKRFPDLTYQKFEDENNTSELSMNIQDITKSLIDRMVKDKEKLFEEALRKYATPPIKGDITPGKIKWRGIRQCIKQDLFKQECWLEQRGKRISEIFVIDATLNINENLFER